MKIEVENVSLIPVSSIRIGECFLYGENIWMRIQAADLPQVEFRCYCVRLSSGLLTGWDNNTLVESVESTATIHKLKKG